MTAAGAIRRPSSFSVANEFPSPAEKQRPGATPTMEIIPGMPIYLAFLNTGFKKDSIVFVVTIAIIFARDHLGGKPTQDPPSVAPRLRHRFTTFKDFSIN
jgi:hypothetical protein